MQNPKLFIDLHQDLASHLKSILQPQTSLEHLFHTTNLFFGSVFVEPGNQQAPPAEIIAEDIQYYRSLEQNSQYPFRTILKKSDLVLGERGVLVHLEGADALTPETEKYLSQWHAKGLRSIGFLWNRDNALGTAAASLHPQEGLTSFGKKMIQKSNELGLLIDCAHLNEAGFYDVLEFAQNPLITHGNAYTLSPHPRNFKDAQIKALARRGGIIGVFFSGKYVRLNGNLDISNVVAHIEHISNLIGTDCIAIGSDFGGITTGLIPGLSHISELPNLKNALLSRGFSTQDINKIFSENAYRYLLYALKP